MCPIIFFVQWSLTSLRFRLVCRSELHVLRSLPLEETKREQWGCWKLSRSGMGKVLGASRGLKFYEWKVD